MTNRQSGPLDNPSAGDGVAADPSPRPPEKPLPSDCCDSGCERCVSDIYTDELAQYALLLAAWHLRHPGRDPAAG